jgi:hypothetical protein
VHYAEGTELKHFLGSNICTLDFNIKMGNKETRFVYTKLFITTRDKVKFLEKFIKLFCI